jgi:hypothetical protein
LLSPPQDSKKGVRRSERLKPLSEARQTPLHRVKYFRAA